MILQLYCNVTQFGQNLLLGSCQCHKLSTHPWKVEPLRSIRMLAELKVMLFKGAIYIFKASTVTESKGHYCDNT